MSSIASPHSKGIPLSEARGLFAIRVSGESMAPRFHPGDMIFLRKDVEVAAGDDVIIELFAQDGGPGNHYLKHLVSRDDRVVTLRQFTPDREFTIPAAMVRRYYKILTTNELFGDVP